MTTKTIAAEAARLALVGAAAYTDPDNAEPFENETPAEHALRLVLLGAYTEGNAR